MLCLLVQVPLGRIPALAFWIPGSIWVHSHFEVTLLAIWAPFLIIV